MAREMWKEYFLFTRKERTAIIVLVSLILIVGILPAFFGENQRIPDKEEVESFQREIVQLTKKVKDSSAGERKKDEHHPGLSGGLKDNFPSGNELFIFDPNTLSAQGWQKLGVRKKTIQTIQNYLHKGGRFRRPEDLVKIYGLRDDECKRLMPYVRISNGNDPGNGLVTARDSAREAGYSKARKTYSYQPVDINLADTTLFIELPGIGGTLAKRIIHFRETLGGFYSVDQVAETFGLPDSVFQHIRHLFVCPDPVLRKLNINALDINALRQHPYIKWNLANAIVQYRKQHGPFQSLDELQNLSLITPEVYRRLVPYLSIE